MVKYKPLGKVYLCPADNTILERQPGLYWDEDIDVAAYKYKCPYCGSWFFLKLYSIKNNEKKNK